MGSWSCAGSRIGVACDWVLQPTHGRVLREGNASWDEVLIILASPYLHLSHLIVSIITPLPHRLPAEISEWRSQPRRSSSLRR